MFRFTRKEESTRPREDITAVAFATCLGVITLLMFGLGYRATQQWRRSTAASVESRANEVLALASVALERDMKGGQRYLVPPLSSDEPISVTTPVYDLADHFARGFARFPYLESFFVWKDDGTARGTTDFFNRADQQPSWQTSAPVDDEPFPVVILNDPGPMRPLVATARREASRGLPFVVFDSYVAGTPYQTLVHMIFGGDGHARLLMLTGFTVNVTWVREHYFQEFIRQIQDIGGDRTVAIEIVDDLAHTVARTGPPSPEGSARSRLFPLLFAERALFPDRLNASAAQWAVRVNLTGEGRLAAANQAATTTLVLLGVGALFSFAGLAVTVRSARAAASFAALQSEFVSAVSHEMKTPLSLIRLAGDTLAHGRYTSTATVADYGLLLAREAGHLTRLIDNVLCYARISTSRFSYAFEPVDVLDLIQESVERFRPQLTEADVDIQLHLPIEVPLVRADHVMLLHVFDNIIDNVVKHGRSGRLLTVKVHAADRKVFVELTDRGSGVESAELPFVFEKFYRGKGTKERGAGLGLAVVREIVQAHGGTVVMTSVVGEGTSVEVSLPLLEAS